MHRSLLLVAVTIATLLAASCSPDDDTATSSTSGSTSELSGSIIVSAAASLTDAFTTLQEDFVLEHPDAEVTMNFGSSGSLATQIEEGAPADVAAFADTVPMAALDDAGLLAGTSEFFARNQLVIVTQPGNPSGIEDLSDLAGAGTISLCTDTAPCGRFADQILADAGVSIPTTEVTRGIDARATLTAVTEGDAVAGIVYVTDARSAGDAVATVTIPAESNVTAVYPIGVVAGSNRASVAEAFVAYVTSDEGQAVLRSYGFGPPP
jgi:molybdate transport system substrate-binding protein